MTERSEYDYPQAPLFDWEGDFYEGIRLAINGAIGMLDLHCGRKNPDRHIYLRVTIALMNATHAAVCAHDRRESKSFMFVRNALAGAIGDAGRGYNRRAREQLGEAYDTIVTAGCFARSGLLDAA